jgi:transcriptional regulator with XRE-family HTH domain
MPQEGTLGQILKERHWPTAALALVADIDESTAARIVKGQSRPHATTAVRMAEGLGIGYGRMRRILTATWESGQAARSGEPCGISYDSNPQGATR